MQTQRQRALMVCLEPVRAEQYREVLEAAGYEAVATDVGDALRLARQSPWDLLLADAILPGCDGVSLARRVAEARLTVHPHVLLARLPGLRLPMSEALPGLGAAVLDLPLTPEAVRSAAAALRASPALPPEKLETLQALLDRLGVPGHPGREMLTRAVAIVWRDRRRLHNLRDQVYPDAARPLGRSAAQAERAIRRVIEAAWRTGEIDEQQRIFGDTIDARRGRPTCGEMIAQLADILRWEG